MAGVCGEGSAQPRSRLDVALADLVRGKVPGICAVVVRGDQVVQARALGLADIASARPMTSETAFLWFSMTKIVTATAVMQLVEQGRLGLDDPVRSFVPEFPEPPKGWPEVRISHLLSHGSGLANPIPVRWVRPAGRPGRDPHEFTAELLARHGDLRFRAGSKASYSNLGYIVLGDVIGTVAAEPFEQYVRTNILAPLGMSRTDFDYLPQTTGDAATGYHPRLSPLTPLLRRWLPSAIIGENCGRLLSFRRFCVEGAAYGGLVGPPSDAARFLSLHVAGGSEEVLSAAGTSQMQTIISRGRKLDVGLGWFRRRAARKSGERYLEHLGGGAGFFNLMRIYPDRRLGLILMANITSYDQEQVAAAVLAG